MCDLLPVLLGGFGEKSNGGTQYHFQNRVYSSMSIAVSITASFNPFYLVEVKNGSSNTVKNGKQ